MALTEAQRLAREGKLIERCIPEPNSGCWLWLGFVKNSGYGGLSFREFGKTVTKLAHRLSYEIFVEPIPKGLLVLHNCDNKICVNPDHLRLGTQRENVLDAFERKRRQLITVCCNGHALTADNLVSRGGGRFRCRACAIDKYKRWYDANRCSKAS